ncbi:phosphate signaling complex protein PhoU [uncultured Shimia sp.]|uniref:phosphate signaling complex protein PhoU n=1 Tax=uncultured Shimia sp. TaxID=573152 RepID=UPI0026104A4C|nr:phosphate signaling complex protein PhoU [uncultured Shimia sp.]
MNDQHIVSAFDRDLEGIQAHVMKMGGLVEAAIGEAANAMVARDQELAEQVRAADKAIDALEELINERCANLIALRAPAAVDLRVVLSVMKIAGNLERIGDYAKNMAKRTSVLVHMEQVEGAHASLKRMAHEVQLMLKDVLDAFIQRDVDLARDVLERDEGVDQMYNALFREFLTFMMEDPRYITPCMHLHFMAKNTERMGDHVTAIAEQVVYLVTGSMPEDARPKATRLDA